MIEFHALADDQPGLAHSPLLRAALLTLQYADEHESIELTKTKAFKRYFVHWAAEHFEWPGKSHEDLLRYNKVLNEFEFPPLQLVHFLLVELRLGRHYKGEFRLTKRGAAGSTFFAVRRITVCFDPNSSPKLEVDIHTENP